jgi:hypothetical protein
MEEFSFPNLWFIVPQTIPQQYLWLSSHQLAPSWPIICRHYRGCTLTSCSFLYTYTSSRECEEVHRRAKKNAPRGRVYMLLVAPQGFEPRSSESESLVLPLNERAIQVVTAAAGSAGATISRLCECTGCGLQGQPPAPLSRYSSRSISRGFCPSTRWLASQPAPTVSRPTPNHVARLNRG